jgi:hypothetical protein
MADLPELIATHRAAMTEYDACDDEDWTVRRDEINTKLAASRRALLDHRPLTLTEVRTKAEFMASDKAFIIWDDLEALDFIHALTPVDGPTEIGLLYKDWLAICAEGDGDIADENEYLARYQALQQRIVDLEPVTARDLAIQTYVDADNGSNSHSDDFFDKIKNLIEGGANV